MIRTYLGHQKPKVWAPICLPDKNWKHGEACHVSGWGASNPITGSIRLNSPVKLTFRVLGLSRLQYGFRLRPKSISWIHERIQFEYIW